MFVIPLAEPGEKAKILHYADHILSLISLIQRQIDLLLNTLKIFRRYFYIHTCIIVYPSPPHKLNSAN